MQLHIEAEKSISENLLDALNFKTTHPNYLSLEKETNTIALSLQQLGYIESELKKLKKQNDSSYVATFFFGNKYEHIKVYYNQEDFRKKELEQITSKVTSEYFILPFSSLAQSLQKLNSLKTENGNAFAKIKLTSITKESDSILSARLILNHGIKRTIDSILVKGYEKFPVSYIKHYVGIKKGTPFNQKKIVAQNETLNSLGFVNTIKPPEALFKKDSTIVYLYLKKQNHNLFDGILGFATDEETQKLAFNGYINLELNNNLNYGEQLLLSYKSDGQEQVNFHVKATLPYLFKSPIGVGLGLKIFKRDSSFVTTEQQARVRYQIRPALHSYIGYKGYESNNLLNEALAGTPIEDFTSRFFLLGGTFTKPQNSLLFPLKSYVSVDAEIGTRSLKTTKEDQLKFSIVANHSFNLNTKNSIFLQNSTSLLTSDTYVTNELYRFGGIQSIRGFNENSIDASLFSVLNTEYRYQLNQGMYIHSIIDVGYFENQSIQLKEKLYSFGIGLGLQTQAGILKLNFANGNTEQQSFNFSNTKIHLSLSSRF